MRAELAYTAEVEQIARHRIAHSQPTGEPVAWMYTQPNARPIVRTYRYAALIEVGDWTETPLYAHQPAIDLPAEREDAARQALEAAAKDAEEWFPPDTHKKYQSFGVVASIRAINPAQFRGEG